MQSFEKGEVPILYTLNTVKDMLMLFVRCDMAKYVASATAEGHPFLGGRSFTSSELLAPAWEYNTSDGFMAWAVKSLPKRIPMKREKIFGAGIAILIANICSTIDNLDDNVKGIRHTGHNHQAFRLRNLPSAERNREWFAISGDVHPAVGAWTYFDGERQIAEFYGEVISKVVRRLIPAMKNDQNIAQVFVGGEMGYVAQIGKFGTTLAVDGKRPRIQTANMDTHREHIIGLAALAVLMNGYSNHWMYPPD